MSFIRRVAPKTIAAQIACLVFVAVLLGVGLSSAALFHFFYAGQAGVNAEILPAVRAARIAGIVRRAREARSPRELADMLETARSNVVAVQAIPLPPPAPQPTPTIAQPAFVDAIEQELERIWAVTPLPNQRNGVIVVKINDNAAVKFEAAPNMFPLHNLVLIQTTLALAIITVMILLLSLYALKRITAPLSAIATAARSFGPNSGGRRPIKGAGPREIKQVEEALRDMRERMEKLVDERTHMLEAISHDLRTPLTRLRLRAERLGEAKMSADMLRDIAIINDMVGETLAYLRDGRSAEAKALTDLPSLLQTVCAQFSDDGHDVAYRGPARLAFACRAQGISRAVANIVDNAAKHAGHVSVVLRASGDGGALIEVSDDGPGIPPAWREKALEPFFKCDSARRSPGRGGFGLGLSIARDIVRRHGGDIELLDNPPRGLTVRLTLGAVVSRENQGMSRIA